MAVLFIECTGLNLKSGEEHKKCKRPKQIILRYTNNFLSSGRLNIIFQDFQIMNSAESDG